jgi:hypothetical protein
MSALPHFSDVDLLHYSKRIIDLNTETTRHRTHFFPNAWMFRP